MAFNPVDVHVGTRVRLLRKRLGLTQGQLADALGMTFQQVQKYERGANRISASKLYEIAKTFRVPVSTFFDGLPSTTDEGSETPEINSFVQRATDAAVAVPAVLQIGKLAPSYQKAVGNLIETLADKPAKAVAADV